MAEAQPWSQKVRLIIELHVSFERLQLRDASALLRYCPLRDRQSQGNYSTLWIKTAHSLEEWDYHTSYDIDLSPADPKFDSELQGTIKKAHERIAYIHAQQVELDELKEKLSGCT